MIPAVADGIKIKNNYSNSYRSDRHEQIQYQQHKHGGDRRNFKKYSFNG